MLTGIVLSDIVILTFSLIGNNVLLQLNKYAYNLLLISFSVFLIISGVLGVAKLRKNSEELPDVSLRSNRKKIYGIKYPLLIGIFLNTSNPMNIIFWIGVSSWLLVFFQPFSSNFFGFLLGLFITTISGDVLKILLSDLLRKYLKFKNARLMRIIVSIMLVIVGFYFLWLLIK